MPNDGETKILDGVRVTWSESGQGWFDDDGEEHFDAPGATTGGSASSGDFKYTDEANPPPWEAEWIEPETKVINKKVVTIPGHWKRSKYTPPPANKWGPEPDWWAETGVPWPPESTAVFNALKKAYDPAVKEAELPKYTTPDQAWEYIQGQLPEQYGYSQQEGGPRVRQRYTRAQMEAAGWRVKFDETTRTYMPYQEESEDAPLAQPEYTTDENGKQWVRTSKGGEWKEVKAEEGSFSTPEIIDRDGHTFYRSSATGQWTELQPDSLKTRLETLIADAIIEGGDENEALAQKYWDFLNQPTSMELAQMALEWAKSPADQMTILAIARGEAPIMSQGPFSRIAPNSAWLDAAFQRLFQWTAAAGIDADSLFASATDTTPADMTTNPAVKLAKTPLDDPAWLQNQAAQIDKAFPSQKSPFGASTPAMQGDVTQEQAQMGAGSAAGPFGASTGDIPMAWDYDRPENANAIAGVGTPEEVDKWLIANGYSTAEENARNLAEQEYASLYSQFATTQDQAVRAELEPKVQAAYQRYLALSEQNTPTPFAQPTGGSGNSNPPATQPFAPPVSGPSSYPTAVKQAWAGQTVGPVQRQFSAMGGPSFRSPESETNMLPSERDMFQRSVEMAGIPWADFREQEIKATRPTGRNYRKGTFNAGFAR